MLTHNTIHSSGWKKNILHKFDHSTALDKIAKFNRIFSLVRVFLTFVVNTHVDLVSVKTIGRINAFEEKCTAESNAFIFINILNGIFIHSIEMKVLIKFIQGYSKYEI